MNSKVLLGLPLANYMQRKNGNKADLSGLGTWQANHSVQHQNTNVIMSGASAAVCYKFDVGTTLFKPSWIHGVIN